MKKTFARLTSAIGRSLLAMLGFSGCGNGFWNGACEYGVPTTDYEVDLTVVDENEKPVKGIRVTSSLNGLDDALVTDADGKAVKSYKNVFPEGNEVKFYFDDVDGEDNGGLFKRDSLTVKAEQVGDGDGRWYEGEYSLKGTKTLKKSE